MEIGWVLLAAAGLLIGWLLLSYNRFVRQRNLIRDSWSNVETELQRRYDLIPNLVEAVRGYADHEREVLTAVTEARTAALATNGRPVPEQETPEQELVRDLRRLLAVAEGYPALRASANFLQLQQELGLTEDRIQVARRLYNANVRDYNIRVQSFPSNLIARSFGFAREAFFEVEEAARDAPAVDEPG